MIFNIKIIMGKLQKIKEELQKLLLKYAVVKTNNGILEYDGEDLVAGMDVFVTDENGERVAAENGEYVTEDNKTITVADGKVESIVDPLAEVDAEEQPQEEVAEDETTEEPTEDKEEVVEEPTEENDEEIKLEDVNEAIENIRKEINELYKLVDSILEKVGETRDEADSRLSKLEQMSSAKPAVEEFEQATKVQKTGDSKLDKFLSKYGK